MNIEITEEIKQKYLANPQICPFCDSKNVLAYEVEYGDETVYNDVKCTSCGIKWTETYTVSDISEAELTTSEED